MKCSECKFWFGPKNPICVRYPPIMFQEVQGEGFDRRYSYQPVWPVSYDNDWCGEFKEISEEGANAKIST